MAVFTLLIIFTTTARADSIFATIFPDRDWQKTFAFSGSNDPVAQKLSTWLYVTETNTPYKTETLIRFTRENSTWPKLYKFRERIEEDIEKSARPHEIAEWFDKNAPKSIKGINAYINALVSLGHADKARAALNKFWLNAELDKKETILLADQYKTLFSLTSHIDRLDNLLWSQRYQEAEYIIPLVDADNGKLAQARIALGRMSSKAPKLIKLIPATMQNDTGLLYDRIRWRRQLNKDSDAVELLRRATTNPPHPELWWKERHILARSAVEKGKYALAYSIVLHHGVTEAADLSQAEWLLGWLSLRFLNRPDDAYRHFEKLYNIVTSAISRSRAAYWLARAAEKMGKESSARTWYGVSAQFPSTFYGQISHEKLYGAVNASQFPDDLTPPDDFEGREMVRVIRLLAQNGLIRYSDAFFIKLLDAAKTRPDFVHIAKLARETEHTRFAVEANKQLQQKLGGFMFTEGYPLLSASPSGGAPETALIHAIIHRESMFDTAAESPAGAKGLMQLMPRTARQLSRNIGQKFSAGKLIENPQYNIELGSTYLNQLLRRYDGSYPLTIAAYNAGLGNVRKWIRDFGDPRESHVDMIDWIEKIPIYETRNYVQRVMESYYIYKLRFAEEPKTVLTFSMK